MASSDSPKPLVDLYGDDNPPLYFEDKVEPKSFRNRLISVLIWTSCLPLILLIFFQQKNFATATDMQNNLQLGLAREAVLYIESDVSSIKSQLTLALSTYALQPRSSAARGTFENLLRHNPIIRSLSYSDEFGHTTLLASPYAVETHAAGTSGQFALQISQSFRNGSSPRSLTAYLDTGMLAHSLSNLLYGRTYAGALFNHNRELVYATPADSAQRKAAAENFTPAEKQRLDTAGGTPFVLRTPGDRFASHIKVFVPIPSLGWTLVLSESQYARDEAMRDMAVIWALGFFVALVGTFVLATLLSMPIARSINALAEAVEKYARTGRFTRLGKELTALGTTEIVTLEEAFARMVEEVDKSKKALRDLNLRLEDEVRSRTSDLLARNEELKTLQTLLAPLSQSGLLSPEGSIVEYCVNRFRLLLELPQLMFETNPSDDSPGIVVRLGQTVYGRLVLPAGLLLTVDKQNSLERLAYALAIVTANARLVEHLRQEQSALQTVFESMTDGVVIIGKSGRIRYANEYAGKLLNDGQSVNLMMFEELLCSHWESATAESIRDHLRGQSKIRIRSTTGTGTRFLELFPFTVSDMPGLNGERVGWILPDITQEASLEAVKENIVGVVAHELKTPITLLQLQAQDLSRTIGRGQMPQAADVRSLSQETTQLGQLVDDLLDVSRIRAGAMKLSLRVVHVESIIDRAEKLARSRYPVAIRRHIDMDAELFCVDPDRMHQVLVNLFNNAARYKKPEQNEAVIDVTTRIEGQNIVIDVADQGIGIRADKIGHIFDQFYQADMTASRTHSGSGLGLTIVRGIIHAHGGTVAVTRSGPDTGTCFSITLPLLMPDELAQP